MITTDPDVVKWVAKHTGEMFANGSTVIGQRNSDGRLVAGVVYHNYTGPTIFVTLAIEHGAVLSRRFVWAIFDYPFNQLKVKQVVSEINGNNEASMKINRHFGFEQKATVEGVFEDGPMVVTALTKDNCHWLKRLHYGQESETA